MDHTYLRVDPDERLPKFIRDGSDHLYATVGKTLKQTPNKQTPKTKRKRESSTPTGRTPVQISKRTSLCDVSS